MDEYDVAIVGGSLAGCAAGTLLARQGARVAILERSPDPDAFKTVCTHYIQASATPVLERLGLAGAIEAAGGVRNGVEIWTRWGWIRPEPNGDPLPYGYNIRRSKLDPMLRELAASTPGVEYIAGANVTGLTRDGGGRVTGVQTADQRELRAKVVVGADGRGSRVARMAGVPGRVRPHNRLGYMAYFEDLPLASGSRSQMWLLDPDIAYAFPNDDGITLIACMPHRDWLPRFKADLEGTFAHYVEQLPEGPDLSGARRVSKMIGKLDMTNVSRPAARGNVAFVGDAALAADPVWGVGCGFALQSGEWLADELAGALIAGGDAEEALDRYRLRHRKALAGHHMIMSDYASGRRFSPVEKLMFGSATRDQETARLMHYYGNRIITPGQLFKPRNVARMVAHRVPA